TILRQDDYVNDGYGGGQAMRINYASPLLGGKIDLTTRYGVSDWQSYERFTGLDSLRLAQDNSDEEDFEFGATYTRPLADKLKSETRFIHTAESSEYVSSYGQTFGGVDDPEEIFGSNADSSETILRSLLRWERSPNVTFEGGAEVAYNKLDAVQSYSIGGETIPLPSDEIVVEETRGEIFGKSTWRARPSLSVETGLRLEASTISQSGDQDNERTFYFVKPRAQVTWTPWADNQFRVRFEREVGQLDFGDFAASASLSDDNVLGGNVNLQPEDRWIGEIAYERRFWGEGVFSIGYRHDEIRNVIDRIPLEDGLSAVGNIGDGTLDQLSLNIVVPTDKLGVTGGRFTFRNDW
ncbi:MAG: TonB-dependent receptor, partial [Caulobacteraceae bacterium]